MNVPIMQYEICLTYYDAEQTAFSIINQYVRFVDEEPDKRKNDWKLDDRWAWFIGDNRPELETDGKARALHPRRPHIAVGTKGR